MDIRQLFCKHDYEVIGDEKSRSFRDDNAKLPYEVWRIIIQRCKKCGKIHTHRIQII